MSAPEYRRPVSGAAICAVEDKMPTQSYQQTGLTMTAGGGGGTTEQIRDLQRDLRQLGYLRSGIDGVFGSGTTAAVKALQHDLLMNSGRSTGADGPAPVKVTDYNKGRIMDVTGVADQGLAQCISDMLDDPNLPGLPLADDPVSENQKIIPQLMATQSPAAPVPFLLGIMIQESGLKHFNEPGSGDKDTFIVVGLDTNADERYIVTSRGYGVGQYTLFHHPPRREEVQGFMLDVGKNVSKAMGELREKFDHFITGPTTSTQSDDRVAEIGSGPLRICKFAPGDPRYLRDCQQCLKDAGAIDIQAGVTPLFPGASDTYQPTQYYASASYTGVPDRAKVGCDWPYAVRRYNGSGMNSYHYQVKVLLHLQNLRPT
jgi:hypothetical protein